MAGLWANQYATVLCLPAPLPPHQEGRAVPLERLPDSQDPKRPCNLGMKTLDSCSLGKMKTGKLHSKCSWFQTGSESRSGQARLLRARTGLSKLTATPPRICSAIWQPNPALPVKLRHANRRRAQNEVKNGGGQYSQGSRSSREKRPLAAQATLGSCSDGSLESRVGACVVFFAFPQEEGRLVGRSRRSSEAERNPSQGSKGLPWDPVSSAASPSVSRVQPGVGEGGIGFSQRDFSLYKSTSVWQRSCRSRIDPSIGRKHWRQSEREEDINGNDNRGQKNLT